MKPFKINRHLDDIFNHCIELMHQGHSVEDCVKLYDSQKIHLVPLLKAAKVTIDTAQSISPDRNTKTDTRHRFLTAINQMHSRYNITKKIDRAWISPIRLFALAKSVFVTEQLDEILNHCIALMNDGHSIEDCLSLYESNRNNLMPLLEAAAIPSLCLIIIASFFILLTSKYILRDKDE